MNKLSNHWDRSLNEIVPYLQWYENDKGVTNYWTVWQHNHILHEIHLIINGEALLSVGNEEISLKKGQCVLIKPTVYHSPQWISNPFCRFNIVFSLKQDFLDELFPEGQPPYFIFEMDEHLFHLYNLILLEYQQPKSSLHKMALSDLYSSLMIHILRILQKSVNVEKHKLEARSLDDITTIEHYFGVTPLKQQTKKDLAALLHCSERQLLRKIYTYYGVSFREKQILAQVEQAKHLLKNTKQEIGEISEIMGYSNAAFHKMFRQQTGLTPAKYRKSVTAPQATSQKKKHQ